MQSQAVFTSSIAATELLQFTLRFTLCKIKSRPYRFISTKLFQFSKTLKTLVIRSSRCMVNSSCMHDSTSMCAGEKIIQTIVPSLKRFHYADALICLINVMDFRRRPFLSTAATKSHISVKRQTSLSSAEHTLLWTIANQLTNCGNCAIQTSTSVHAQLEAS